jgi:hypothetical protein
MIQALLLYSFHLQKNTFKITENIPISFERRDQSTTKIGGMESHHWAPSFSLTNPPISSYAP